LVTFFDGVLVQEAPISIHGLKPIISNREGVFKREAEPNMS
jgi:hypothetical protein